MIIYQSPLNQVKMRTLLLSIPIIFLISCNNSTTTRETVSGDTSKVTIGQDLAINPSRISGSELPAELKIKGNVQDAWKWSNKAGENFFITTEVPPYDDRIKDE